MSSHRVRAYNDEIPVGITAHDSPSLSPVGIFMANQFDSAFLHPTHDRPKLLLREVEHKEVFFCRARSRETALVACELEVPVALRWADEGAVVAVVT